LSHSPIQLYVAAVLSLSGPRFWSTAVAVDSARGARPYPTVTAPTPQCPHLL